MTSPRELIRKYEPVLRFSTDGEGEPELFFPMAARDYVHTCGLRRRFVGWEKEPGSTLFSDLITIPQPEECYLVFAAGDLGGEIALESGAVLQMADHGLELAQAPPGDEIALEGMRGERQIMPRMLLDSGQAAQLEQALDGETGIERQPVIPEEVSGWFSDEAGETAAPGGALESAALDLEWVQFPALAALPAVIRARAIEKYEPFRDWTRFPPVYHFHVSHDRGYIVLQYWFLYAYNDWASHGGHNDHEGDWEVIYVFLDQQEQPRHVAYSRHVAVGPLYGPSTAVWADVETVEGTHPVVYVGCGSHASYITKGKHRFFLYIDRAKGDDIAIGPGTDQAWGKPVSLSYRPWNRRFSGPWGALITSWLGRVLPNTEGPSGPGQKGDKWSRPATWADIPPL